MNKSTIIESNGENIMDFLERLLDKKSEKEVILNSISFYFSNSQTYINDWRVKERKKRIKEEYQSMKLQEIQKIQIYREISKKLEDEFLKRNIDICITPRIVRHAIESA